MSLEPTPSPAGSASSGSPARAADWLASGDADGLPAPAVPNHTVFHCIGGGAYGKVWLARSTLGEWRAVKAVYRRRFEQDARAYRREYKGIRRYSPVSLRHESLLAILQVGRDRQAGCFYYLMEAADHVDGARPRHELDYRPRTLAAVLMARRRLPSKECASIAAALAEALERLHREGLVHRDVKPANIIFVHGRPKLADVGLVAAFNVTLTEVGTLGYIAPDLFSRPEGDVYALGKVLYEMATGLDRLNFPVIPPAAELQTEHRPVRELSVVCSRACTPLPKDRYPGVAAMLRDLRLLEAGESLLDQQRRRLRRALRRKWLPWIAAGACLLLLAAGWRVAGTRAQEQARLVALRDIRLSRGGVRIAGWFANNWENLRRAAAIALDDEVREQAVGALAVRDARRLHVDNTVQAGPAAFSPSGVAIVSGVRNPSPSGAVSPTLLVSPEGVVEKLPSHGEGPVCWAQGEIPLQFLNSSNASLLVEARSGSVRGRFPWPAGAGPVRAEWPVLALTDDGRRSAAALTNRDGAQVMVWDTAAGQALGEFPFHATTLAFNSGGTLLAAGGGDGRIEVRTVPGLELKTLLPAPLRPAPVYGLALTPDRILRDERGISANRWLVAAGYEGGEVIVWDGATALPRSFCLGAAWRTVSVAFSPDGATLASAGRNNARLWDIMTGRLELELGEGGTDDARALAFDATGSRLLWGTVRQGASSSAVSLWEINTDRGIRILRGLSSGISKIWFSPTGHRAAALSHDWRVAVWELPAGRLLRIIELPMGDSADSAAGAFDVTGACFAFAGGSHARLYDLPTGRVVEEWPLKDGLSDQLAFDPHVADRLRLVRRELAAGWNRRAAWHAYDLEPGRRPHLLSAQTNTNWVTYDLALRPGGDRFLAWNTTPQGERRSLIVVESATGRLLREVSTDRTAGEPRVFIEPTGRWFGYTDKSDNRLRILSWDDFAEAGRTEADCQAFDPSLTQFAGNVDNRWCCWDRGRLDAAVPLSFDWRPVGAPGFSPDGRLLAMGTLEGAVLLLDMPEVKRRLDSLRGVPP